MGISSQQIGYLKSGRVTRQRKPRKVHEPPWLYTMFISGVLTDCGIGVNVLVLGKISKRIRSYLTASITQPLMGH